MPKTGLFDKKEFDKFLIKNKVSLAMLFGSYAKDSNTISSDIDLAVWIDKKNISDTFQEKLFFELQKIIKQKKFDLVILNYAEPLLQFCISCEGKLLYERNEGDFLYFKLYAFKRYDDARKFLEVTDKIIQRRIKEWKVETKRNHKRKTA